MRQLKVASIVEGDGEVPAVPILLRRIAAELIGDAVVHVLKPIRQPRERLLANKDNCLRNSVGHAVNKLRQFDVPGASELILLVVDADKTARRNSGRTHWGSSERSDRTSTPRASWRSWNMKLGLSLRRNRCRSIST